MQPPFLSTYVTPEEAVRRLRQSEIVALPTETVYGLAGDAASPEAVARIFALKGRPAHNPLIVHVHSIAQAQRYAHWNDMAESLAQRYWPGPLTLVLPVQPDHVLAGAVLAGGDSVALRMPAHQVMRKVLGLFGGVLAAPSANRSGRISPTMAAHVAEEFAGQALAIVDGGACLVGLESTVVDCTGSDPVILRPGSILIEQSQPHRPDASKPLKSPGLLSSHYAPRLPVRLNAQQVEAHEALLAFGAEPLAGALCSLNLSPTGCLQEAATNLYAMLRALDASAASAIAVMPIPEKGVGKAIMDRLHRAAAPRS